MERAGAMNRPSLSIVMPAFDEAAGIEEAVAACISCGHELLRAGRVRSVETVVVDDGSRDGTGALLDRMALEQPDLRVVHHGRNRGLGAALRSGFDHSRGDLVFYTDSDLPVDLSTVGTALELMDAEVDAVCAYRTRRRGEGPRRFVYSVVYNELCRWLLGIRMRDVNFAAKLVRGHQVRHLGLRSEGSFIDAEMMGRLQRGGGVVRQFPAQYRPRSRGVSTLSSAAVVLTIAREFIRLAPEVRRSGALQPAVV